jgi:hypothetical protein
MDAPSALRSISGDMARYRCHVYVNDRTPRYVVLLSLQWEIIDCRYLESGSDLYAAMMDAIKQATREGWEAEGTPDFGFVFLRRGDLRRLLMLTPRDPVDSTQQSFNPFRA